MKKEYRGFTIVEFKAHNTRTYQRIYKGDVFKQTSNNLIDAKRLIDFCLNNNVRGWK